MYNMQELGDSVFHGCLFSRYTYLMGKSVIVPSFAEFP